MNPITPHELSNLYRKAHNTMRNIDGLQPQEAFDELLKFIFLKQSIESKELEKKTENINPEELRELFTSFVESRNSWFTELWRDKKIHLSDSALSDLDSLFRNIRFTEIPFDLRSGALKEYLTPDIRRGLGIYLTPDDVVKMMVEIAKPKYGDKVFDPACGSGTFLIETLRYFAKAPQMTLTNSIWGIDKNPRMLILAELNLGDYPGLVFNRKAADSLFPQITNQNDWPQENYFDLIFTNPPFGVSLDSNSYDLTKFDTCKTRKGNIVKRQASEIVFIEQCIKYLKPGGTLAIVLPKSIATNSSFNFEREVLDKLGYVYLIINLPSDTFNATGTQSTTLVLFIRKFVENEKQNTTPVCFSSVTNVGYDSTGRTIDGNQLPHLHEFIHESMMSKKSNELCKYFPAINMNHTFSELRRIMQGNELSGSSVRLKDIVEECNCGRSPKREDFTDSGLFLVKVGNLSGKGINWSARDRNFIDNEEKTKRLRNRRLMLQEGDILLTASAHKPEYIGKKVDIVYKIPNWLNGIASYTAEVLMIRPKKDMIDPFILLAYLRSEEAYNLIKGYIQGQTAHLYPAELLNLPIPKSILSPNTKILEFAESLRLESEVNDQVNIIYKKQQDLLNQITFFD